VNHSLLSVTYLAIKQLLLSRLQVALGLYVSDNLVLNKQQERHIPVHRAKNDNRVLYVSGIALQLSGTMNIPPLEIATALSSKLVVDVANLACGAESSPAAALSQDFTVQVVPPGWIHLELTEPAIAAWLQCLSQVELRRFSPPPHHPTTPPPLSDSSRLFAVQYAHARCCSLVRLAHGEGLIMLKEPELDNTPRVFLAVAPNPIPWLNCDQKLRFCHPAERALIAQLVGLLDDLYYACPSRQTVDWEKAALNLSQAFQNFYSCCRIWGEVKIQTPHLAQARLGLVIVTQAVLRLLLQDMLGVWALLEL
jgi:hypothetical protein